MYIGIDCGTQGTKAIILDSQRKQVVGVGYATHGLIENTQGRREQTVEDWINAFKSALHSAIKQANISPKQIKGIGVSGQQHGLVMLDENDRPLYNVKLWCDTETAQENADYIAKIGGNQTACNQLGIMVQTGYTASKLAWFRKHYPEQYQRISKIMLPHDYLNYWLTGNFCTEYGDASGTGYFDINKREWHFDAFKQLAPELDPNLVLPQCYPAQQKIGFVLPHIANEFGLSHDVIVSTGGGDNMMGAIGTGNITQGIVTMSLGTSGTLYTHTDTPIPQLPFEIANFCSSTGSWLPLICVMNMTSANKLLMDLFQIDVERFNQLIAQSPIGAEGIRMLPFFNGERVPPLPEAKATIFGLDSHNFTQANLARATIEAASFTLRYGLDLFHQAGLATSQIRLIGGGAKSAIWRQMIADIMNVDIICLKESESAALGGAIQAMWANNVDSLTNLCQQSVHLDLPSRTSPVPENVQQYQQVYEDYRKFLEEHYLSKLAIK